MGLGSQDFFAGAPALDSTDDFLFGAASTIGASTFNGPTWGTQGAFEWDINWTTDGTSGFLVQHIQAQINGTRANGAALNNASVGLTPDYFEVWEVDGRGTVTGNGGTLTGQDFWHFPALGPFGSQYSLSATGTMFWTDQDPARAGYTSGGVRNSGQLLSSTTAPPGIGAPLLVREAHGAWSTSGDTMLPGCYVKP